SAVDATQQILNGISQEDLILSVGQPELEFYDDGGSPKTYAMTGTTGLKATLQTPLDARLGTVVGLPVNSTVVQNGANATYTITGLRFGRIMNVQLSTGQKHVF